MAAVTATEQRELLRLATAGSVDDGKSTLIGRLLLDTKLLLSDQLAALSEGHDGVPDLAALTDGLRAEREQGITIDVAYRYFATPRRSFILADTPGHERYTRNMFTGASTADLVLVLVDARAGVVTQTRRHAQIAALLRIPHVVVAINKMDLVEFAQDRFDAVAADMLELARSIGLPAPQVVPISALDGDNVVDRSLRAPWYDGPPLIEILETVDLVSDRDLDTGHLRLPIQWVARPRDGGRRVYTGQLAAGTLSVGDEVVVVPSGARTTVTSVRTLDPDRDVAVPPMSVGVTIADDIDIGRGDLLSAPDNPPPAARELDTTICWMSEEPLAPGRRYALKHTSRTVRTTVQAIRDRWDPETLEVFAEPSALRLNDIGRVSLRTSSPVLADPYRRNGITGAFIVIDEHSNDTVGAGIIREAREVKPAREGRRDVTWHPSALDRERRWNALSQGGATVWLTGLPASGKSTIAVALERQLVAGGQAAYLLDGDNIRHGLSDDLGFAPGDRAENVRRVGQVARLFADAGVVAVVSLVSPLRSDRIVPRQLHEAAGLPFIEVYVDTDVDECARRDPKGLYARARSGEIKGFTGVDAPYEPPEQAEIHIETATIDVSDAVERILAALPDAPMTDVSRSYLVCATQRSGSTLLCELLKNTGVAGRPEEYFEAVHDTGVPPHPGDFLEGLADTGLAIRHDARPPEAPAYSSLAGLADYRAHLERTFALGTTPNGVFGAKLMFNQLGELQTLAGALPEFAGVELEVLLDRLFRNPRYIWISRRDTVRQAVSMWKALQTRRWRAADGDGDDGPTPPAPQYSFDAIDHLVRRFEAEERGWGRFFTAHGIEPLTIGYEHDLTSDPDRTVQRALEWVGVAPPAGWDATAPMDRQGDADSDDWVASYHRDRAGIGSRGPLRAAS